jgi:lipopolysaccharide/colanic/teichoic acid biosynthesis glycosyltransferase
MTTIPIAFEQTHPPRRRARQGVNTVSATDAIRRVLNIVIALLALALLLPVGLLIAVAIKLTSEGPVFFTQTRIGLNRRRLQPMGARYREADSGGRPFRMYKFRTMRPGGAETSEAPAEQVWATPDDPRVTRVGRILRLYRLDELPQLVNVVIGDMDIVGPRPEQPAIFAQLREQLPRYQDRQQVRPGITGWAQINQHYDSSIEDVRRKLTFDLEYINRRSITEDLRIMLLTLPVLTGGLGAW